MVTEGAGGLGTGAIERCIDGWVHTEAGQVVRERARVELVALVRAAGYDAGLIAALIDAEYILTRLLGAGEFAAPPTPERCYSVTIGQDQHKSALRALRAARAALAGRGAAGARDETAALVRRALVDWCAKYGTEVPAYDDEEAERLIDEWLPGWLDALRAGGAGEGRT